MAEFEQIYKAYFNDVFLYIKSLSQNESVAEEITSETFFKAMRSVDDFRGDCDIRVWLCQIAKNCFYSYLKKTPCFCEFRGSRKLGLIAEQRHNGGIANIKKRSYGNPFAVARLE